MDEHQQFNRRVHERWTLPAAYTSVEACREQPSSTLPLTGHAYDVSEGGVRIELDQALPLDEPLQVRLNLPGETNAVAARARVVWVNDAIDDPGPRRMALQFKDFVSTADRDRLLRFIGHGPSRMAA